MFRLILVSVAVAAYGFDLQRPNLTEWKASQANASETAEAKAAREAKMAAVNKVVEMLEGVQSKVLAEGEEEAKTYNKFACFCKDTTKEKKEAIQHGEDEKSSLTAHINSLMGRRSDLDDDIKTFTKEIETAEDAKKKAAEERSKTLALYTKNSADLAAAIEGIAQATEALKASDLSKASLLQVQNKLSTLSEKVEQALYLADAIGIAGPNEKNIASMFLQKYDPANNVVPTEDYKFHSDKIITTLENLAVKFTNEKNDIDAAEVKSVAEHDMFMQEKTNYIKAKNLDLDDAQKQKAKTTEEIASASGELSEVAAVLLDDQEYLKELARGCSDKARTWDQRSSVRQDELYVLTEVIGIIKGTVKEKTSAATIRFNQQAVSLKLAEAVARSQDAMEAVEAGAEAAEGSSASFLQRHTRNLLSKAMRNTDPVPDAGRSKIAGLLKERGDKLHSSLLLKLASQIQASADPFAKVKKLIQDLIEKMLAEAANEANQKGWCDKAIADATQKRDYAAQSIEELNTEMASLEATRDTLNDEIATLSKEIQELEDARTKAEFIRKNEKAQNAATVLEAQEGLAAVDMAVGILDKFYKTSAKASVSLSQGPFDGDAPDAGFKNFEAYTGSQGEASGIVGMLEVMKSDFERTIAETEAAEAEAEQDHLEFMTETGKSLAEKNTAKDITQKQLDDALDKLQKADDNLQFETSTLKTAIKELLELQPACVDTGMSYEERVARREQEIASLKQALCILKAYQEYGPDGAGDAC